VPAPSGAILALIPLILDFELSPLFGELSLRDHTLLINLYIVIIALLLPSRLPTLSLKKIQIKQEYLSLSMIVSAIIIITIVIYPWYSLPLVAILYVLSIPVCMYVTRKS
jgi:CDP-diacylglycerol--serine O-phosphatidyltransferase